MQGWSVEIEPLGSCDGLFPIIVMKHSNRTIIHWVTFWSTATPSSMSNTTVSTPNDGIFSIFRLSIPGTYITALLGLYLPTPRPDWAEKRLRRCSECLQFLHTRNIAGYEYANCTTNPAEVSDSNVFDSPLKSYPNMVSASPAGR